MFSFLGMVRYDRTMIEHILDGARVGHGFFRSVWWWLRGWTWTTNLQSDQIHMIILTVAWDWCVIVIWRHRGTTHKWPKSHPTGEGKTTTFSPCYDFDLCKHFLNYDNYDLWQHRLMVEYSMVKVTLGPPPHAPNTLSYRAPEWIKHWSWFTTVSLWGTQDWWPSRPVSNLRILLWPTPGIWYLDTSNLYGGYHCQLWSAWIWN